MNKLTLIPKFNEATCYLRVRMELVDKNGRVIGPDGRPNSTNPTFQTQAAYSLDGTLYQNFVFAEKLYQVIDRSVDLIAEIPE